MLIFYRRTMGKECSLRDLSRALVNIIERYQHKDLHTKIRCLISPKLRNWFFCSALNFAIPRGLIS